MQLINRIKNFLRGRRQLWGTAKMRQALWDKEFAEGHWEHIDHTAGDCVYAFIEKYARKGAILDLGCGAGNTGVELDAAAYTDYLGVDISQVAVQRAQHRSTQHQRADRNRYERSDIESYVPDRQYDVILFRESLCYIPNARVTPVLQRYSNYLKLGGVFIVRLCDREAYDANVRAVEAGFAVVEKYLQPGTKTIVIVFQPQGGAAAS